MIAGKFFAIVVGFTIFVTGCAASITPPENPSDPVRISVIDYGRHTSLVLPADAQTLREYTFGDWDWYAENRKGFFNAMDALFFSDGATLGRRDISRAESLESIARSSGAKRLLTLQVDGSLASNLLSSLDRRYAESVDTEIFNPKVQMTLVRDPKRYGLFHNCNHVTARWLEQLGCTVRGCRVRSNFRLDLQNRSSLREHSDTSAFDAQTVLLK